MLVQETSDKTAHFTLEYPISEIRHTYEASNWRHYNYGGVFVFDTLGPDVKVYRKRLIHWILRCALPNV